jgi:D-alanyl-D-alanine carboxypeptidase (penicillin-binding protein 5/6)
MVMHVLLRTSSLRTISALLAVLAICGGGFELAAQQQQQQQQQQPQPSPNDPSRRQPAAKPKPPPQRPAAKTPPATPGTAAAPKGEPPSPSQVGITTVAKQAFMVDPLTSTVMLYKDADAPMHPSSMAKMMTIYLVFEDLAAGRIKLDTRFKVSERARNMGGSRMFLELGSDVTVEELIKGMIVLSGNDACVAIAEGLSGSEDSFADRMTKRGKELGLTKSVFKNSSGWPADGQYTTARDLAVLAWRTIEDFPQYYRFYAETNWTYHNIKQDNRNRLLKSTPGVDGLKTGHTEEGGFGQATSAIRDGRRLIMVLNGMGSMAERAQESGRLLEWGFREFANTTVFRAGDVVAEAPVWLGAQDKVPLVIPRAVQITAPTGQTVQPRVVARFDGPLPAPIVKGSKLGTAAVTLPDGRVVEYPLQAGADVERQGVVGRVVSLVRHYVFGWLS